MQAAYEPTDLATFTAELASDLPLGVERAGLRLRRRLPAAPRAGLRRPRDVGEDRLNLLSNAFKFTFEGRSRSRSRWAAITSSCRCATPGRASPRRSCRGCSSVSTGSRARAGARTRAPASGSRSSASSPVPRRHRLGHERRRAGQHLHGPHSRGRGAPARRAYRRRTRDRAHGQRPPRLSWRRRPTAIDAPARIHHERRADTRLAPAAARARVLRRRRQRRHAALHPLPPRTALRGRGRSRTGSRRSNERAHACPISSSPT